LLLASLKDRPGALCEGLLLQEALNAGVSRAEIQSILGKSASWISNRISLVTRLDSNVYEMVKDDLLDSRSAQEIARLPGPVQFTFAETAVHECLPKSAIESLVAGYNDESCPDAIRRQILKNPRMALKRMTDRRRAVKAGQTSGDTEGVPPYAIDECIESLKSQMAELCRLLPNGSRLEAIKYNAVLKELETELLALLATVSQFFSPGKMEVEQNVG